MDNTRRLRHQLSETRSQWEELVHGAPDAICIFAPDGTIRFANARWRDLLGIEGEELVGGNFGPLIAPEERPLLENLITQTCEGHRLVGENWQLRHRSGIRRDVLVSAGPIRDENGRIMGLLAIFHDITAAKEAQRLKDDFIVTASHELRTPATTIWGMTEFSYVETHIAHSFPNDVLYSSS